MWRAIAAFLLAALPLQHAFAEPPAPATQAALNAVEQAGAKRDAACQKADVEMTAAVIAAQNDYGQKLQKALGSAMDAANLDEANRIKAEMQHMRGGNIAENQTPKGAVAVAAREEFEAKVRRAQEDRGAAVQLAQRQYGEGLRAAMAEALRARELDLANQIKTELDAAKAVKYDALGHRVIDLLALVDPSRDTVCGQWTLDREGLTSANLDNGKSIRLPYRPGPEYDFAVDFTVGKFYGGCDVTLLCSAAGHSFAWANGWYGNKISGFDLIGGQGIETGRNPTARRDVPPMQVGRRCHCVVQVRRDRVTALLDGREISTLKTDFSDMDVRRQWSVGEDVLGVCTLIYARFNKIEVTEISGAGQVIERLNPDAIGQMSALPSLPPGKSYSRMSLIDLQPISSHVGWGTLDAHRDVAKDFTIGGKPCDRWIFAHAPSSILYDVPSGAVAFTATAPTSAGDGSVRFFVYCDNKELVITRTVKESGGPIPIVALLPLGTRRIELRADVGGNFAYAQSEWAYPEFVLPAAAAAPAAMNPSAPADNTVPRNPLGARENRPADLAVGSGAGKPQPGSPPPGNNQPAPRDPSQSIFAPPAK